MKNKAFIRILVGSLAVAMLVTALAGCNFNNRDKTETDSSSDVTSSDKGNETSGDSNFVADSLPADLNYGGAEVKILGWKSEVAEFEAEKDNGIAIDAAIYRRNESVKSRLGVTLNFNLTLTGNNGGTARTEYAQHLENTIISGKTYDIIGAHTGSIVTCTMNGLMQDLGAIDDSYLEFEKPWWNSSLIDTTSMGNTFYFCTGDASTSFAQMVYCVYFNEDAIGKYKLDSPYDLVDSNEWTYEQMIQMGMNVYVDNNSNSTVDLEDDLPLIGQYYDWPAVLDGCGVGFVTKDASGSFVLTDDIKGAKSIEIMDRLSDFVRLDGAYVATDENLVECFMQGRSVFLIVQNGAAARWTLSNANFGYGCVPMPKYDSYQTDYRCAVRKPVTLFGMPRGNDSERIMFASAVLECYASEGYRQTTPVIFEQVMKGQSSSGGKMSEMLTLIRDSAYFDAGRIYASEAGSICDFPGYYLRDGNPWENYINQKIPDVENLLAKLSVDLISVTN